MCGFLGHDEKHCPNPPCNPDSPKQYGEWLRANGNQKNNADRPKSSNSWGYEDEQSGHSSARSEPATMNLSDSISNPGVQSELHKSHQSRDLGSVWLEEWKSGMIENCRRMKKWEDGKYLIFPLVCLVGGVEKWEGGKLFYLIGEKKRMMENIIYIN